MYKYHKDDPTLEDLEKLYEENSKELIATTWPRVRARVSTQNLRVEYLGCDKTGLLYFKCTSGTTAGKFWHQKVEFKDLAKGIQMLNKSLKVRKKEIIQMLIDGDIRVTCDDPSWHYYFKYTAWKGGYGIDKETRSSNIRNPKQDKSLCKHLTAALLLLPRIAPRILNDYNKKKVFPSTIGRVKNRIFGKKDKK